MGTERPFIQIKDREENFQGILDLKLKSYSDCIPYIRNLTADHASHVLSGSAQEEADGRHLWVFGVVVGKPGKKQRTAYVKIQLGKPTLTTPICISFHPPEFKLTFLFASEHATLFQKLYDDEQSSHR